MMSRRRIGRVFLLSAAAASIVGVASLQHSLLGQDSRRANSREQATGAAAERAPARGRLPAYYAQVVDDKQRERIYSIQKSYSAKIEALEAELKAVTSKRDAEIEAVLTPQQRQRVAALEAEAKAKRDAGRAAKDAQDAASEAQKAVEAVTKKRTKAREVTCIGGLGHDACGFDLEME